MELKLKKLFKGGGDISSVDTNSYFKRFMLFVSRIIVVYRKWYTYICNVIRREWLLIKYVCFIFNNLLLYLRYDI